ncbi:MAG: HIT family protein [bacterium]
MSLAVQPSCPFCDLIHGAGEVSMCYEDADVVGFMDIQPVNAGHVLVVPREHFESLDDIPPALAMHLFEVAMDLAPIVKQVARADALNVVVNSGAAAGQDVFHYHVHVIPRKVGDGFEVPLPFAGSEMPDRTVLDVHAARIIAAYRDPVASRTRQERRSSGERRQVV